MDGAKAPQGRARHCRLRDCGLAPYPAWVLDVTPAGVKVTESAEASDTPVPPDASVAVLPFVNMSGNADNEYFSDGLSEELLNLLTRLQSLRVCSRTSSQRSRCG